MDQGLTEQNIEEYRAGAKSAAELLVEEKAARKILTFCGELDVILGGGVCTGQITEFCKSLFYSVKEDLAMLTIHQHMLKKVTASRWCAGSRQDANRVRQLASLVLFVNADDEQLDFMATLCLTPRIQLSIDVQIPKVFNGLEGQAIYIGGSLLPKYLAAHAPMDLLFSQLECVAACRYRGKFFCRACQRDGRGLCETHEEACGQQQRSSASSCCELNSGTRQHYSAAIQHLEDCLSIKRDGNWYSANRWLT